MIRNDNLARRRAPTTKSAQFWATLTASCPPPIAHLYSLAMIAAAPPRRLNRRVQPNNLATRTAPKRAISPAFRPIRANHHPTATYDDFSADASQEGGCI